jgi:hypothetical protein
MGAAGVTVTMCHTVTSHQCRSTASPHAIPIVQLATDANNNLLIVYKITH